MFAAIRDGRGGLLIGEAGQARQACSPLIQLFFGFASDVDQTNTNRDIRDGYWLSNIYQCEIVHTFKEDDKKKKGTNGQSIDRNRNTSFVDTACVSQSPVPRGKC